MLIHFFNFQNKKELNNIKNKIKELGISKNYLLKNAKKNVWKEIINNKGIIISTSRFEGRNLVIQEAFHNYVPVVATDCLGQKELLSENHSFILNNNNPKNGQKLYFQL